MLRALAPAIVLLVFCGALGLAYLAVQVAGWKLYWGFVLAGIGLPLLWIIASALNPALPADRRCPECHQERALVRPTRGSIVGVMCTKCDYRDDEEYIGHLEIYLGDPDPDDPEPDAGSSAPPRA